MLPKQYVGKSERPFYFRLNNYSRHRIKSIDQNNLILVEQDFYTNSHDFNTDAKFAIIKRIEKDTNMKSITLKKKEKKKRQMDKKSENKEHLDLI